MSKKKRAKTAAPTGSRGWKAFSGVFTVIYAVGAGVSVVAGVAFATYGDWVGAALMLGSAAVLGLGVVQHLGYFRRGRPITRRGKDGER